jgi:oxygen-independent coproporphyrinogen-3 oxidase
LVANREYLVRRYVDAIRREIAQIPDSRPLATLYFGGGTPSHLAPTDFAQLLDAVQSKFSLDAESEFSIEANPQDVDEERVQCWRQLGVTRVSLGVQSFAPAKLKLLQRDHDAAQVLRAVSLLAAAHFQISIDLIFGTPGESLTDWRHELEQALSLPIHHLSTYELTYEKGTSFWNQLQRGELSKLDEDLRGDLYALTIAYLRENNWCHYEISSFCRHGYRCRHNQRYWNGSFWWGVGPSAASYFGGRRWTNHPSTVRYLQLLETNQSPINNSERLAPPAAARELLAIGLRQIDGIQPQAFAEYSGYRPEEIAARPIANLTSLGILISTPENLRLSDQGIMVYDSVASEILAAR